MSTKGMSVTAARSLVERLSQAGVTTLVLHDFDKAGFSIVHTLRTDTRRYQCKSAPLVVDLGLRLAGAEALGLESEAVEYDGKVDPQEGLRKCGATEAECAFLVRGAGPPWSGARVELNAMTSDQFIGWLERKLAEAGVEKMIPDQATLEAAYRRAHLRARVQEAIDAAVREARDAEIDVPTNLEQRLRERLPGTASSWDNALWKLAEAAERPSLKETAERRRAEEMERLEWEMEHRVDGDDHEDDDWPDDEDDE
jgi:hypothetical protein